MKQNNCDHVLGVIAWIGGDEYLLSSLRDSEGNAALAECQRWLEHGTGDQSAIDRVRSLNTPEKALADRTDFFDFCPRCGIQLDVDRKSQAAGESDE